VEGIGYKGDDEVILGNFSVESFVVCDIEVDRFGVLYSFGEFLCAFEGSAS
jgi:hypothetical protein